MLEYRGGTMIPAVKIHDHPSPLRLIRWWIALGFLFCSVVFTAVGQDTEDQIAHKLVGTHGRDWVLTKWETFLGPGNRCKKGQSYRFSRDYHVAISACVDGHIQAQTKMWSLDLNDPLDTKLKIGDTWYILIFSDRPEGHFMTLRTKPRVKTEETVDRQFELQED
jgi:hypothetical protein